MSERPFLRKLNALALLLGTLSAVAVVLIPATRLADAEVLAAAVRDSAGDTHDDHAEYESQRDADAQHSKEHATAPAGGDACCSTKAKPSTGDAPAVSLSLEAEEMCGEHRVPEAQCGICQPDKAAALQPGEGLWVRLASGDAASDSGIETHTTKPGGNDLPGQWLGRVVYDPTRSVELRSALAGQVLEVAAQLGDHVKAGQLLARIAAPELTALQGQAREAEAQAAFARQTETREAALHAKGISSAADLQQAQAARQSAGLLAAAAREQLARYGANANGGEIHLLAPFDATIVEQHIVAGQQVDAAADCFDLADTGATMIEFSVPVSDAAGVAPGQVVATQLDDLRDVSLQATISWIAPRVDERTRTLRVRASVPNPGGILREGMLARATRAGGQNAGMAVPVAAVQQLEGLPFVFVQHAPDLYEARRVEVAPRNGDQVGIREGLESGETIAVARAFVVKSEFLRARMGAGCTDH